jgi:hypothetical protein
MELQFINPGGKQKLTLAVTREADMTNGRTTLACPLCESHRPDDYKVVGYGSQADGVREFHVLRCRVHGVEFADALPKPCVDSKQKAGLDYCYGDPNEPNLRYIDFMDRVEAVTRPAGERLLHDVGCCNGQLMFRSTPPGLASARKRYCLRSEK